MSLLRSPVPIVVLNDTRIDRHHGCTMVMSAIERLSELAGMKILATSPAHSDWETDANFLRAAEKARLIIVNGEGTIHHDRSEGGRLLMVGELARDLDVPAVLINASWEANGSAFHESLKHFALVAVRETTSAEALQHKGQSCTVVPDLSLYFSGAATQTSESARQGVVFSDSVNRFTAVALDKCRSAVGGDTLSIVYPTAGLAGYFLFLRQGVAKQDFQSPIAVSRLVAMRHRLFMNSSNRPEEFLADLSRAALLVSGRFHACSLALTMQTPFICVPSNTGKNAALIADAGLERWREVEDLTPAVVRDARGRGWSEGERASMKEYLTFARSGAEQLFHELRGMC